MSSFILQKYSICLTICFCSIVFMYFHWKTSLNSRSVHATSGLLLPPSAGNSGGSLPWQKKSFSLDNWTKTWGRAKEDGRWIGTNNPIEIYAYTAFFDDRTSLKTLPVIRVIIVTEALNNNTLYCMLQYKNRTSHQVAAKRLGRYILLYSKQWRIQDFQKGERQFFSCILRDFTIDKCL